MAAQDTTASLQNGVGERESPAFQEMPPQLGSAQNGEQTLGEQQLQSPDRVLSAQVVSGSCGVGSTQPLHGAETTTGAVQAEPKGATMTLEPGGRLTVEQQVVEQIVEANTGYVTPTSSGGPRNHTAPNWMSGREVPRWMMRLGSFLNQGGGLTTSEMAPSPLPGGSPLYPSPPGGAPFRMRSPSRARPISAVPTPPSTSTISAEAIQAEVQRQLHGVMVQLREYGLRNEALQAELEQTKAELEQARNSGRQELRALPTSTDLLGGLTTAQLDPGVLQGDPIQQDVHGVQRDPGGALSSYVSRGDPHSRLPHSRLPVPPAQQGGDDQDPFHGSRVAERGSQQLEQPQEAQRADNPPGLLRSWWGGRPRSQSPPPRTTSKDQPENHTLDVLSKGIQQLQELQAQALAKGHTASGSTELVKPGTSALAPLPELTAGCDAALAFQDWLEIASSVLSDVSELSGWWWKAVMEVVTRAYEAWLRATPLERLNIYPSGEDHLMEGKWSRLNARVASMLLGAMSVEMKGEMVAQRISQSTIHMIYRLHTLYQPGGSAERAEVLRRLQAPRDHLPHDTVEEVLKAVRAWPRLLSRCQAVNMMPPDASVLAKGLMGLTDRYIQQSTDAAFRTSMLRTSLRLDGQPTLDNVRSYQRHLQAELETMISSKTAAVSPQPKLKAVDTTLQPKAKDAAKPTGGGSTELCKYFMKPSGCRRGERCTFSHSMASLDREQRGKKCLKCGAENHRQRDCPVGKPKAGSTGGSRDKDKPSGGATSAQSTMATVASTSTASSGGEVVQGTPWTLETLMQAAQQVVQGQTDSRGETSPEKTRPEMKVLRLRDIRVCALKESATALLDSGATHALRSATSGDEWETAENVMVQLAGNHQLTMRITKGGTLLMPPGSCSKPEQAPQGLQAQTIVPMGGLIETLGYTLVWSPDECMLQSPEGAQIKLQVQGGCPQMCELEALSLIARLEDRKLENLNNETITTSDKLAVAAMAMERHWNHYLYDYVATGAFESGLRAVRDAPFFEDLPGDCLAGLVPPQGLEYGWDIMKLNGFFNRAQRRKLLSSKRWVVHLFTGREGHWEIFKLDKGDTSVIELDLARCAGHDILRGETWRMLLWGAKQGKVDVILGGPPGRSQQLCRGGERDSKSLTMVARMMWLFAVAQVGRELHGVGINKDRDVGFILEYPEGTPWEQRQAHEREIIEAEDSMRDPTGRGRGALWVETIQYWEQVQRPRWENQVGLATVNASISFWDTRMWKAFQREAQTRVISFDQGAMGGKSRNRTSLGTNVRALMSLDEVRLGLVQALVVAMSFKFGTPMHNVLPACTLCLQSNGGSMWKAIMLSTERTVQRA